MSTKVTSAQIVNSSVSGSTVASSAISGSTVASTDITASTVNSTPIGASAASTGRFVTPSSGDNSTNAATTAWCLLGFAMSLTVNKGYIKLPTWLGGWVFQWAQGVLQSTSGSTQTVDLLYDFDTVLSVMVGTINSSPTDTSMSYFQEVSRSTGNVVVFLMRNADHAFDPITPTVWAIGK